MMDGGESMMMDGGKPQNMDKTSRPKKRAKVNENPKIWTKQFQKKKKKITFAP